MRRGVPNSGFRGRPQIAIANTASDLTPCNAHLDEVAQWVKNGVYEAGALSQEQFTRSESSMIRSKGHCNTMGTASTMALVAEALGMILPGLAGTPAPDSRLLEASHETGMLAVELVLQDRRPSSLLTKASFHNAIVALAAIGGSTNAVVHLLAIAGRLGIKLSLDDFDRIGAEVPLLVNLQPAGTYLMDDLFRAGGCLAVMREVRDLLDHSALTVSGRRFVEHLDIDENSVMVLRGCGPRGYPGMPEVANMPLPQKLLARGIRDMVRICDGRMSGTAYGTVVLHVTPEAAAGGPLALIRTGDIVHLDVPARRLDVEAIGDPLASRVVEEQTARGFAAPLRGWERLYVEHVQQADTGADLDFLIGSSGSEVSRESH